ncbi:radical SAM protein [bacterium]|nr:radical SAM protein [candidate division CSSED10-310 bacterium]
MKLRLKGRDFDDLASLAPGTMVFLGVYTSRRCNLRCRYCFEDSGRAEPGELPLATKLAVIDAGAAMGARTLYIAGAGEPLLDHGFKRLVLRARAHGMYILVYTNGLLIDAAMASWLKQHSVTLIVKIESLSAEIHDGLTGCPGSHERVMRSVDHLLDAGYAVTRDGFTDLGAGALYTRENLHGLKTLHDFCVNRNIKLMCDVMGIHGRAGRDLMPTREDIAALQESMGEESAMADSQPCIFWNYGLLIDHMGHARFCTEIRTENIGNIRDHSLAELNAQKNRKYPACGGVFSCPLKEKPYLTAGAREPA